MQMIKSLVVAMIIAITTSSSCFKVENDLVQPDHLAVLNHYRTRVVRVVDFDYEADMVYAIDGVGHIWSFYGIEDWAVGDWASILLYDNNTRDIRDDVIIKITYGGIFE